MLEPTETLDSWAWTASVPFTTCPRRIQWISRTRVWAAIAGAEGTGEMIGPRCVRLRKLLQNIRTFTRLNKVQISEAPRDYCGGKIPRRTSVPSLTGTLDCSIASASRSRCLIAILPD